jgi:hypothetical protein
VVLTRVTISVVFPCLPRIGYLRHKLESFVILVPGSPSPSEFSSVRYALMASRGEQKALWGAKRDCGRAPVGIRTYTTAAAH